MFFTTTIGNFPGGATVEIEITCLGELKHDAEIDGIRLTIPTSVCSRYVTYPGELTQSPTNVHDESDVEMPKEGALKTLQSPSHPVAATVGSTSRHSQPAQPPCSSVSPPSRSARLSSITTLPWKLCPTRSDPSPCCYP